MNTLLSIHEEKMQKSIKSLLADFDTVRAGRANPVVLDQIRVDYYGAPTPINGLAAISVPDPHMLVISPWDKSCLKSIEKAISASELGIHPQNDGSVIRLAFPQLTEERRKELVKQVQKKGEGGKIAIRSIRRDAMEKAKAMEKKKEITEDDLKQLEKKIQDMHDKYIKEVEAATAKKEKEIMAI
ncbi:MAG: ribosome recycling factor [Eubacteriales bacterium]|jgi:ribosome recycling factor